MFEIEENTLDELPYSITCLQFACLAYEAAPENVNSMRHLECSKIGRASCRERV